MGYNCYGSCGPSSSGVVRRYSTKEERLVWLREYQEELAAELQAVKERIDDVEKA